MGVDVSPFGLRIGHASNDRVKTGVTVVLTNEPMIGSVFVMGGGPGGRETDFLEPHNTIEHVDAIVLTGGSVFGLAAADGATSWLAAHDRGFETGTVKVPIVPAAVLFDLANGGDKTKLFQRLGPGQPNLYHELGWQACDKADQNAELGSVGAGTGATTANLRGGFGAAIADLRTGGQVLAVAAVNAVGSVTMGDGPHFHAAPFEQGDEFGGLGSPSGVPQSDQTPLTKVDAQPGSNTTIAAIVTNLRLTKSQCRRLAMTAHDGLARSIHPAHTPMDGDTIFSLSSGTIAMTDPVRHMTDLTGAASAALARAVGLGVYHAAPDPGGKVEAWQSRFGSLSKDET